MWRSRRNSISDVKSVVINSKVCILAVKDFEKPLVSQKVLNLGSLGLNLRLEVGEVAAAALHDVPITHH